MHRIDAGGCNRLKQRGKRRRAFLCLFYRIGAPFAKRPSPRSPPATGRRWPTLYDCMGRSLFSVAYAVTGNWHDAEDVLQETLLDACRTAPSYRPGTSACAWLLAIARHKALDCVRRTGVRPRRDSGR